jgi:hypothetical protein
MQLTKNGLLLLVGRKWPDTVQHWKDKEGHGCNRNPLKSKAPTAHHGRSSASPTGGNE